MCWAERAGQPGCILLTVWNHMSAWMQFAKRLILPSSKERVPWSYCLHRLKLRTTDWSGLFCSGGRRMCCLYTSQAKQSHVICPKYPVTYPWSLSHPHVSISGSVPALNAPDKMHCLVEKEKWQLLHCGLWIIWQRVPSWICAREHSLFVDGCEEQVA